MLNCTLTCRQMHLFPCFINLNHLFICINTPTCVDIHAVHFISIITQHELILNHVEKHPWLKCMQTQDV